MNRSKALVVLSGGQDSATTLFIAMSKHEKVYAITFAYSQRHDIEIACARMLAKKYGIPQIVVDISFYKDFVNSSLVEEHSSVNTVNDNGLPSSFVHNRNQLFLTLAHSYAARHGIGYIYAGMCQEDYSGYPDCRQDFITALEQVLYVGSGVHIPIVTPIMNIDKAETFSLADKHGKLEDVLEYTHTCYNGERNIRHSWGYGCGECPACVIRRNGYNKFMNSQLSS